MAMYYPKNLNNQQNVSMGNGMNTGGSNLSSGPYGSQNMGRYLPNNQAPQPPSRPAVDPVLPFQNGGGYPGVGAQLPNESGYRPLGPQTQFPLNPGVGLQLPNSGSQYIPPGNQIPQPGVLGGGPAIHPLIQALLGNNQPGMQPTQPGLMSPQTPTPSNGMNPGGQYPSSLQGAPPRYQQAIDAGRMTPQMAAMRWGMFQHGQLPGQQPQLQLPNGGAQYRPPGVGLQLPNGGSQYQGQVPPQAMWQAMLQRMPFGPQATMNPGANPYQLPGSTSTAAQQPYQPFNPINFGNNLGGLFGSNPGSSFPQQQYPQPQPIQNLPYGIG